MKKLYIENTFFEDEITHPNKSLEKLFMSSKPILQLQFLPFLYANKSDTVLVTNRPSQEYLDSLQDPPKILLFQDFLSLKDKDIYTPILWGASDHLASLFKKNYFYPSFQIVKKVHSKLFCFENTKILFDCSLLTNEKDVQQYIAKTPKPLVIKTLFGRSGSGHFLIHNNDYSKKNLKSFLGKEFSYKRAVLGQLWLNRLLDFSTQWEISSEISFKGLTIIENDPFGSYQKTHVNKSDPLLEDFYNEHLSEAKILLEKVKNEGFFGPIGIDAMIYEYKKDRYHHILEANCRNTMSLIALKIQKKNKLPNLTLSFTNSEMGLLPSYLETPKKVFFKKNIIL